MARFYVDHDEMYPVYFLKAEADAASYDKKTCPLIELTDAEHASVTVAWKLWRSAQQLISTKVIIANGEQR